MREVGLGRLRKLFAVMWFCGFVVGAALTAIATIQFNLIWMLFGFNLMNLFFILGLICLVEYRYGMNLQTIENHMSTLAKAKSTGKGKGKGSKGGEKK